MSVNTETGSAQGQTTCLTQESVYASLFDKINLTPASSLGDINAFLDDAALSDMASNRRCRRTTSMILPSGGMGVKPPAIFWISSITD